MELKELIAQISDEAPKPDALGVYRLQINDQHLIHLRASPSGKRIFLYAKCGDRDRGGNQTALYETLMEANLFGQETGNAQLVATKKAIVLMQTFISEILTKELYETELQSFVDTLVHWKEKLASFVPKGDGGDEDILHLMSQHDQQVLFI